MRRASTIREPPSLRGERTTRTTLGGAFPLDTKEELQP